LNDAQRLSTAEGVILAYLSADDFSQIEIQKLKIKIKSPIALRRSEYAAD